METFTVTNEGIRMRFPVVTEEGNNDPRPVAVLACRDEDSLLTPLGFEISPYVEPTTEKPWRHERVGSKRVTINRAQLTRAKVRVVLLSRNHERGNGPRPTLQYYHMFPTDRLPGPFIIELLDELSTPGGRLQPPEHFRLIPAKTVGPRTAVKFTVRNIVHFQTQFVVIVGDPNQAASPRVDADFLPSSGEDIQRFLEDLRSRSGQGRGQCICANDKDRLYQRTVIAKASSQNSMGIEGILVDVNYSEAKYWVREQTAEVVIWALTALAIAIFVTVMWKAFSIPQEARNRPLSERCPPEIWHEFFPRGLI